MKTRPKKFSTRKSFINPLTYDMNFVHRFIKRCIKGTSADVKTVKTIKGMEKKGYLGLALFEDKKILLNAYNKKTIDEFYLTFFHEITHYFFRDYEDLRDPDNFSEKTDITEIRAEKSAKKLLVWYNKHKEKFEEIKDLLRILHPTKLTKEEKEYL